MHTIKLGALFAILALALILVALGHASLADRPARVPRPITTLDQFSAELARTVAFGFVEAPAAGRVRHRFVGAAH